MKGEREMERKKRVTEGTLTREIAPRQRRRGAKRGRGNERKKNARMAGDVRLER